jgi:hypothetical protein
VKKFILLALFVFTSSASAGEVYLGKNLSKVAAEQSNKLRVQINDLPPVYFVKPITKK